MASNRSENGDHPSHLPSQVGGAVSKVGTANSQSLLGPSIEETFYRKWGDMAAAWGINRTMAEIQGLLYITGASLCMDEVMQRLGISRGNASMSLRSLVEWGVVRKTHRRGDRRVYFESLSDVWEIFTLVARQRKRKEIDPILVTLRDCERRLAAEPESEESNLRLSRERLTRMLAFLSTMEALSDRFIGSHDGLARAVGLLAGGR